MTGDALGPIHPAPRPAVAFIFVTLKLDALALGVSVPVLPKLVLQFEGGDSADAAAVFGVFGTAFSAMQFLFAPVLGALSDRLGRRPVILLALSARRAVPARRRAPARERGDRLARDARLVVPRLGACVASPWRAGRSDLVAEARARVARDA